jgi:hypothetical protein
MPEFRGAIRIAPLSAGRAIFAVRGAPANDAVPAWCVRRGNVRQNRLPSAGALAALCGLAALKLGCGELATQLARDQQLKIEFHRHTLRRFCPYHTK